MPLDPRIKKKLDCNSQAASWIGHGYRVVPEQSREYEVVEEIAAELETAVDKLLADHGADPSGWPYLADKLDVLALYAIAGELRPQEMQAMIDLEDRLLPPLKAAVRRYL